MLNYPSSYVSDNTRFNVPPVVGNEVKLITGSGVIKPALVNVDICVAANVKIPDNPTLASLLYDPFIAFTEVTNN